MEPISLFLGFVLGALCGGVVMFVVFHHNEKTFNAMWTNTSATLASDLAGAKSRLSSLEAKFGGILTALQILNPTAAAAVSAATPLPPTT